MLNTSTSLAHCFSYFFWVQRTFHISRFHTNRVVVNLPEVVMAEWYSSKLPCGHVVYFKTSGLFFGLPRFRKSSFLYFPKANRAQISEIWMEVKWCLFHGARKQKLGVQTEPYVSLDQSHFQKKWPSQFFYKESRISHFRAQFDIFFNLSIKSFLFYKIIRSLYK